MNKNSLTNEEASAMVDQIAEDLESARQPGLKMLSDRLEKRSARLKKVEARLVKDLGKNDPQVVRLRESIKKSQQLKQTFDARVKRAAGIRKPAANEWLVYGRVLDPSGAGQKSLVVKAYDQDPKRNDLLGKAGTDENGDFQIYFTARDFSGGRDRTLTLFVEVETKRGRSLHRTEPVTPGRAERVFYYKITLDK